MSDKRKTKTKKKKRKIRNERWENELESNNSLLVDLFSSLVVVVVVVTPSGQLGSLGISITFSPRALLFISISKDKRERERE
jgi:hypothetical protein